MKFALTLAVGALVSCAALPAPPREEVDAPSADRLALYLGMRGLDEEDYEPVEDQFTLGLEFAHEREGSALGFEIGLLGSRDDGDALGFDIEGRTGEIYAGIRKSFPSDRVRPYVGGGVSYIDSEFEVTGVGSDDDASIAGYVHGGVLFDLSESFFLGIDVRLLLGSDLEIVGVDTDADYQQYALVLGFSL